MPISLLPKDLKRKLLALYGLLFLIPVGYLFYVIIDMLRQAEVIPTASVPSATTTFVVGVGAALILSLGGLFMMYRSAKTLHDAAEKAEAYFELAPVPNRPAVKTDDEAEKISEYISTMLTELRQKVIDVDKYAQELDHANKKLVQIALKDGLTGLYNQMHIRERLSAELARARQYGRNLSVLMLDIDNFKTLNDTYGHLTGDRALQATSHLLAANLRQIDIPSRFGGEEFLVVLPETDGEEAEFIGDMLRRAIANNKFNGPQQGQELFFTVSIGVGSLTEGVNSIDGMILVADKNLYKAKKTGKNKVCR